MRGLFFFVIFGLGVDSWRERAISEVRGLRDERGPTQLGIYTRISPLQIPVPSTGMTSCSQLDRNIGCGAKLCRSALLSACIS